jgi:hypothetical protein
VTAAERAALVSPPERGRETSEWVSRLARARPAFREQLADRQSIRVPDPDPEYGDHGLAWPALGLRSRDAIMQPPAPEMPAAPGLARDADPEAGS